MTTELMVVCETGETVMITTGLCLVTPLRLALTKRPTVPTAVFAVYLTWLPDDELSAPMVGFVRVHAYVAPGGHVNVHAGVAVNAAVPLTWTEAEVGAIATEASVDAVMVMIAAWLWTVTPLSEALTKIPTVPAVRAAVNLTGLPVYRLRAPIVVW